MKRVSLIKAALEAHKSPREINMSKLEKELKMRTHVFQVEKVDQAEPKHDIDGRYFTIKIHYVCALCETTANEIKRLGYMPDFRTYEVECE